MTELMIERLIELVNELSDAPDGEVKGRTWQGFGLGHQGGDKAATRRDGGSLARARPRQ